MATEIKIGTKTVGPGHPVFIVAELSGNHLQNFETAAAIVRAAKGAGADAVKLQTYTADTITLDCDHPRFRLEGKNAWAGKTLHQLYTQAFTPWEWQPRLKKIARDLGLECFSSPFDFSAADFLEKMEVPAYKIASFELVDIPLLRHVAKKGKPVILSTGLGKKEEIKEAVEAIRAEGNRQIILLQCVSAYPALPEGMHLKTIPDLIASFDSPAGLSDHTLGSEVAVAAVALGACLIEKHLTLSRAAGGPDASFSMEPVEFKKMSAELRRVEKALGEANYQVTAAEEPNLVFRRSLFVVKEVRAGEILSPENIRSIRPSGGLHPRHYEEVLGKRFRESLPKGTPLKKEHYE